MIALPFLLGFLCYILGNEPLARYFLGAVPIIIIGIICSEMKQKRTLERFNTLMKWIKTHKRYSEFECYDLFTVDFYIVYRYCKYNTNFDKMFWRSWEGYAGYNRDNLGYSQAELSKCNKWSIEEQNVFFDKLKERCEQLKQENKL